MADRKISDLTALTTPAAGDYLPIVDISEAAASSKNKRITIEELMRGAPDGTAGAPGFAFESDPNSGIYSPGADQVAISTGGTGRLFVDASGNVGVGTSPSYALDVVGTINSSDANIGFRTALTNGLFQAREFGGSSANNTLEFNIRPDSGKSGYLTFTESSVADRWSIGIQNGSDGLRFISGTPTSGTERCRIDGSGRLLVGTSSSIGYGGLLQVVGGDTARPQIHRNVNDEYPAVLYISKARGTGVQSVLSGDEIGNISFIGYDGTQQLGAASITCFVDGTPGTNDMPGRIVLATTADGASSPTERMRISQNGTVTINGPGGGTFLNLSNSGGYSGLHEVDNTAYTIGQNSDLRAMRIGSGANWLTTGVNLAPGGTSWGTYSDERLKTDIVELTDCLDNIKGIRCISYRLTDVDDANSKKRIGVIAQDLVGKYDEAINASRRSENDETEYLSVQYSDLIPVLLKALQEASVKIETLEARLTAAGI